jgi:ubiquilin
MKVQFKVSQGSQFELEVDGGLTVSDLKALVSEPASLPAGQMRIIFRGRILKDAETLSQNQVEEGSVMHVVKAPGAVTAAPAASAAATPAPAPASSAGLSQIAPNQGQQQSAAANLFGGMGGGMGAGMGTGMGGLDPATMTAMLQNPQFQQMMQQMASNPQVMQQMIQSNPMLAQMAQQNPQVAAMLQNPQLLQMMMNPQMIQAAMAMQQMQQQMQQPGQPGQPGMNPAQMAALMQNPMFNQMMAASQQGQGEEEIAVQPAAMAELQAMYADQLNQLEMMGFNDRVRNVEALSVSDGNVEAAINYLLTYTGAQ